jgi:hypothetical protein
MEPLVYVLSLSAKDKSNDTKDSFSEEAWHVFDQFTECPMEVLFDNFNTKICRKDIFKPTFGMRSLHDSIIVITRRLKNSMCCHIR